MRFESGRSIYQQIVEYVQDRILRGEWDDEARLPAVRELAVQLGVNPNTVQRSYSTLQDDGLIYNQRGVGYFVAAGARERSRERRRHRFEAETLPRIFETMEMIGYGNDDLVTAYTRWATARSRREEK
ncbi:MAG: GntR family transcriptional regulator [Spirochaeta sp.]|jgi:GntR family transcriptional regulator|nr:GntR family transcriptional regulator [Spirochaeta sp.]